MKKLICGIIVIGCAITIMGTVGALDVDTIGVGVALKRLAIAMPTLTISLQIGGFFK